MTCVHLSNFRSGYAFQGTSASPIKSPSTSGLTDIWKIDKAKANKSSVNVEAGPVHVHKYNVPVPDYIRGIYLTNYVGNNKRMLNGFIKDAKENNINTFIVDVQRKVVSKDLVSIIKKAGIFPVARVVVFEGGLKRKKASKKYIAKILLTMEKAAKAGFQEIQLDYIRYADARSLRKLSLKHKYSTINAILAAANKKATELAVYLSADIFGRITLNYNDHIGQKLENFSQYLDVIYPMLYPSHYNGDPYRMSHPYETVKEGVKKSVERCKETRIVAYIQGFKWKVNKSGKSLQEYIRLQIKAVDDAGGHGWIIWNARNKYKASYKAINQYDKQKKAVNSAEVNSKVETPNKG